MENAPLPTTEPMSAEQTSTLAEFARACKTAARSVSLYPAAHPAIQASLGRVATAAGRLTGGADLTLTVLPDALVIDGRSPARPDASIRELAALLHERLVGELRIGRAADVEDWRALLLLLARVPEELIAEGGITRAWAAGGRSHFDIREIDYAEVLRERAGGESATWDQIVASCLHGDGSALDDRVLSALLESLGDTSTLSGLLERLDADGTAEGVSMGARAAALLAIVRRLVEAASARRGQEGVDLVLQRVADATTRLTPEMLLGLVARARSGDPDQAQLASDVVGKMGDVAIASFVAGSVVTERGASERLAQAFEALVPERDRKERLLDLARTEAQQSPLGAETGFEDLWQSAASMLASYSDEPFVSSDYARELSGARTQAIEVERVSDDPPDRIQTWMATVTDDALRQHDLTLLLDLLRLEDDPARWRDVAGIAVTEIERRTLLGQLQDALALTGALARERGADGRPQIRTHAAATLDTLASGPFVRHIVLHARKAEEGADALNAICQAIGPALIRPLAEALSVEENHRVIKQLRDVLLGFGAAGRQSVEQLKSSPNPAVRRTAIELLRAFGGREALAELTSMLDDADPQVQRESIRAIVQIGSDEAYAVLQRALLGDGAWRETILQQLIGLRDDKAAPLLCYVLTHSAPRGRRVQMHAEIIEALGGLSARPESTRTLRDVLHRGEWWAPFRTAALRRNAAIALRRLGSRDALAVLDEAATSGSRGVRAAAKAQGGGTARRERP